MAQSRQARAECGGSMALPRGNSKTGTGTTLKLHYPLTHHRGLMGGHTDQVEVSVKEGRLGPDPEGREIREYPSIPSGMHVCAAYPLLASYWNLCVALPRILLGIWLASGHGWHLVAIAIWLAFAWHWFGIASGKTAVACFPIPHSQQHRVFANLASFVIAPLGV